MATPSSKSLQDLIREDFLTCKICYDLYTVPKILPCLHSYCQKCLELLFKNGSLQCPECRLQTDVPGGAAGLKTNFFINGLLEMFQMKNNKDLECTICMNAQKTVAATSRCLDCKDFLCHACTQGHCCSSLTLHHKIVNVEEFLAGHCDMEVRLLQELHCQDHPQEAVRFFCDTCSMPICRDCRMLDHIQHNVISMTNAAQRERPLVEQLIKNLEGTIGSISEHEKAVEEAKEKVQAEGEHMKEKICKYVEDIITYIFAQKETALEKLNTYLGEQLEVLCLTQKDLQSQKEKAVGTQEFSQRVLSVGKDYEILHLEGMIQNKVEELQAYKLEQIPRKTLELSIAWGEQCCEDFLFRFVFPEEQPKRDFELNNEGLVPLVKENGKSSGSETKEVCSSVSISPVKSSSSSSSCCVKAEYAYEFELGPFPSNYRKTTNITGIAVVSHTGQTLLLDQGNNMIKYYSPRGQYQKNIPVPDPHYVFCGISVCGDILACSSDMHLFFLTLDGEFFLKIQLRGSESSYPLASYRDSYVAVSEGSRCSISLYSPSGFCVGRVEPHNYEGGKFLFIAVNSRERFVVLDFDKKQIVIMKKSGQVLNLLKPSVSLLSTPFSLCVDKDDNIFVVDQFRVIRFSSDGQDGNIVMSDQKQGRRPRILAINGDNLILVREGGSIEAYCLNWSSAGV